MDKENFKQYLEGQGHGRATIERTLSSLYHFIEWLSLRDKKETEASYPDMLDYIRYYRKKNVKPVTIQKYLLAIRHYYRYLCQSGHALHNPAEDLQLQNIKRKHHHHILSPVQLSGLYAHYPIFGKESQRHKAIGGLIIFQAVRTTELKKLQTAHLRLAEGTIEIPGSRKHDRRTLTLEAVQILDMHHYLSQVRPAILLQSGQQASELFPSMQGSENLGNSLAKITKKFRALCPEVKNLRQVRASTIVHWLKAYNLREVQQMAGHRYISSTENYRQDDMEGLIGEIEKYHPLG